MPDGIVYSANPHLTLQAAACSVMPPFRDMA